MTPVLGRTLSNLRWLRGVVALGLLVLVGCERKSNTPAPPEPAKSPAQEKFDQIVEYMNRMLVESDSFGPGGYVQFPATNNNPALGQLAYTIEVDASPQVLPPRDPGGPERASIKVTLKTSYSRTQLENDEEEGESSAAPRGGQGRTIDEILEDPNTSVEDLSAENLLEGTPPKPRVPQRSITTKSRSEEVVFDLEFVRNKWKLASKVDSEVFPSALSTLEAALERQR